MGVLLKHRWTGAVSFSARGSEEVLLIDIELAKEETAQGNACVGFSGSGLEVVLNPPAHVPLAGTQSDDHT